MFTYTVFTSLAISLATFSAVRAQSGTSSALVPLASKRYTWPNIAYQVTGDQGGIRGPQAGYNLCNSTTENQDSKCQTLFLNDLADFCIWSSGQPNDTIGESEAREFAWCSKPGHGTRLIPPGAITGAQWLYSKNYVQVVGFIDQTKVNLQASDQGGELDPHGADEQGNPLGGIVFTNGFSKSASSFNSQFTAKQNGSTDYTQVIEWINFIGGGVFCLKMCNPSDPNAAQLCQHIYDEIGCNYNAVANYGAINGTFSVCDSDDMAPPGIFTDSNGHLTTWYQPLGVPITTIPYTTTIPSSSNCQTYASTDLYAAAATALPQAATTTTSATASNPTGPGNLVSGGKAGPSASRTGSGSSSSPTSTSSSATISVPGLVGPLIISALTILVQF